MKINSQSEFDNNIKKGYEVEWDKSKERYVKKISRPSGGQLSYNGTLEINCPIKTDCMILAKEIKYNGDIQAPVIKADKITGRGNLTGIVLCNNLMDIKRSIRG